MSHVVIGFVSFGMVFGSGFETLVALTGSASPPPQALRSIGIVKPALRLENVLRKFLRWCVLFIILSKMIAICNDERKRMTENASPAFK
jgi:hypothetical protein